MSDKVVLYDLPCKGRCAGWSPNVWKTRLVLNYKDISYRTQWITHPEIGPTFEKLGIPANTTGPGSQYTVPVIQLTDGEPIMDSAAIATRLESLCPDPTLRLENGLHEKIGPIIGKSLGPLIPVFMPRIGRDKIVESSEGWFQEARKQRFGMSLDELEQAKGGEQAWAAAQPGFEELKQFLTDHKQDEGPFVLGSRLSYVDFVLVSTMEAFRRIGNDLFERLVSHDERLRDLHKACEPWLRDDQ